MPQHEGSCFGESRNGARGRGEPFLHPCLPVPALWDHGNQQLKLDCDREVRYLVSSSNGEGSLRHRDSSQDKPAGPSGVGLGGGAASGPQADSSPGRHPAHQHHNDRDLGLGPGIAGHQLWARGLLFGPRASGLSSVQRGRRLRSAAVRISGYHIRWGCVRTRNPGHSATQLFQRDV